MYIFSLIFLSMAVLALSFTIYDQAGKNLSIAFRLLILILNVAFLTLFAVRGAQ